MKCWFYCCLPNELNDSIRMKCKVNNNTTNFCKKKQAEVSIANGLSCDVNDKKEKLLDSGKLKLKSKLIRLLILVKLNNTVQKMTKITHWLEVPEKLILLRLGKPYGNYYQKSLKSPRTCCIIV